MFPHGSNPNEINPNSFNPNNINFNNYNPHSYSPDHPMKVRGYVKSGKSKNKNSGNSLLKLLAILF